MRSALIPRTFRSSKFTVIAVNYVRSKILVFTSWIWLTQVITLLQLVQFLFSVSQEDVFFMCADSLTRRTRMEHWSAIFDARFVPSGKSMTCGR